MTILLTGGSGFLGSHIAETLSAQGTSVRALVRRSSNTKLLQTLPNVELVYGAMDDLASLKQAASGVEGVIHAAGVVKAPSKQQFQAVNAQGTARLLAAVKEAAPELKRFVLVSSLAVAGPSKDGRPVAVGATPNPVTEYGRSKLGAERAALAVAAQLPVTIIRPPLIYGPRDSECFAFFKAVSMGVLPLTGSPDAGLSATYVTDCASACIAALDARVASGSVYFVDDGRVYTLRELIAHIEEALHKRAWLRFPVPKPVLFGAAVGSELVGKLTGKSVMLTRDKLNELWAPHWVCDSSALVGDMGWEPKVTFDRGARITAEWYRKEGWLK